MDNQGLSARRWRSSGASGGSDCFWAPLRLFVDDGGILPDSTAQPHHFPFHARPADEHVVEMRAVDILVREDTLTRRSQMLGLFD